MVDLAGAAMLPTTPDQRMHYPPPAGPVGYRVTAGAPRSIAVRHSHGRVSLEDRASGASAEGATYLDAIQALGRATREQH